MTHTIIVNEKEFAAHDWREAAAGMGATVAPVECTAEERHPRNQSLLVIGVGELGPGEVYFCSDLTFVFDTLLELKGDGRKFVVIASENGRHVAKPY